MQEFYRDMLVGSLKWIRQGTCGISRASQMGQVGVQKALARIRKGPSTQIGTQVRVLKYEKPFGIEVFW